MTDDFTRKQVLDSYDRWSDSYDTDDNATRDLDATVTKSALSLAESADVVELGCGTGKNTRLWASVASSVTGLDFSEGMLEKARGRDYGCPVDFIRRDLTDDWHLEAGSSDLVTAQLVLEHIADLEPVFRKAQRVLRPGGRFLVSELHPFRQYLGSVARFEECSEGGDAAGVSIPAFIHEVSDFVNTGVGTGFELVEMREVRGADDERPRLLVIDWRAPSEPYSPPRRRIE